MKDVFTVKEIMNGTGLTRQRVHQLIKSRGIPVIRENKHFLLKWQDLLQVADNTRMLNFLKDTLDSERKLLDEVHDYQEENEKAIQFAKAIEYARILLEGDPGINSQDSERWSQWFKAGDFFERLMAVRNPAEE
ncbi:hypothetical protein ACFLWS_02775 [Chloroflexota bacterium]